MWCITGIPGSGKTTICKLLQKNGVNCVNALQVQGTEKCVDQGEVDTECLKFIIAQNSTAEVVEAHFSHLLRCSSVIILERDESGIIEELKNRGYDDSKIRENIDALRADVIYSESLEKLPAGRIHRIKVKEGAVEEAYARCRDLIFSPKNKD